MGMITKIQEVTKTKAARWLLVVLLVFPLVLVAVSFLVIYKYVYTLLPRSTSHSFVFSKNSNCSTLHAISEDRDSNTLAFSYILHTGCDYPVAGLRLELREGIWFDLSGYDYLSITMKATKGVRVPLYLETYVNNYTKMSDESTFRSLLVNLNVDSSFSKIDVPISKINTPDWWYIQRKKTEKEVGSPDLSKTKYIAISNCINIKPGVEDLVSIASLSFHVDYVSWGIKCFLLTFAYYLITGAVLYYEGHIRKHEGVRIAYRKVELPDQHVNESQLILSYLQDHFTDPDLTVEKIQVAVGMHERKVSSVIRSTTGESFKQYVTQLRIEESKRLLKETDLSIADVAFKSGYGNPSHFGRAFKASENCSPLEYRKSIKAGSVATIKKI